MNNCIWIILLLLCCGNRKDCDCGCKSHRSEKSSGCGCSNGFMATTPLAPFSPQCDHEKSCDCDCD